MAAEEGARAKGVKRLVKLEEDVVNKIAAGEVIQRPHNALKEIIENAIDAGASRISVVVRDGGNRSIQVSLSVSVSEEKETRGIKSRSSEVLKRLPA